MREEGEGIRTTGLLMVLSSACKACVAASSSGDTKKYIEMYTKNQTKKIIFASDCNGLLEILCSKSATVNLKCLGIMICRLDGGINLFHFYFSQCKNTKPNLNQNGFIN